MLSGEIRQREFLERRAVLVRQGIERIRTIFFDAEIEEMIRILFPSDVAPQVRIGHPQDHLVSPLDEKRLEIGREEVDRPLHDVAVAGEAFGSGASRALEH